MKHAWAYYTILGAAFTLMAAAQAGYNRVYHDGLSAWFFAAIAVTMTALALRAAWIRSHRQSGDWAQLRQREAMVRALSQESRRGRR